MFLCSLFSKVMAVTLPLVLLLYDYVFAKTFPEKISGTKAPQHAVSASGKISQKRSFSGSFKLLKEKFLSLNITLKDKTVFFVLAAAFIAIGMAAAVPAVDGEFLLGFFKNAYRAAFQYSFYAVKFFLPLKLSIVYPYGMENNVLFMVLTPAFIFGWAYLNYVAFKKSKRIFFGLMFFTVTVLPVLNLIPFGLEIPADRFTYIPYAGLIYSLVIFVSLIRPPFMKKIALLLLCFFIVSGIILSRVRVGEWENNITLFSKSIERYPSYVAYTNRGAAYIDIGEYDLALADELMALETGASYDAVAHILLSYIYKETGRYEEALESINAAFETASDGDVKNVYMSRAELYRLLGQPDKAVEDLRYLYDYYDDTNFVFWTIADIYEKEGKFHLAAVEMDKLLALEPNNKEAGLYRKQVLLKMLDSDYPIPGGDM